MIKYGVQTLAECQKLLLHPMHPGEPQHTSHRPTPRSLKNKIKSLDARLPFSWQAQLQHNITPARGNCGSLLMGRSATPEAPTHPVTPSPAQAPHGAGYRRLIPRLPLFSD